MSLRPPSQPLSGYDRFHGEHLALAEVPPPAMADAAPASCHTHQHQHHRRQHQYSGAVYTYQKQDRRQEQQQQQVSPRKQTNDSSGVRGCLGLSSPQVHRETRAMKSTQQQHQPPSSSSPVRTRSPFASSRGVGAAARIKVVSDCHAGYYHNSQASNHRSSRRSSCHDQAHRKSNCAASAATATMANSNCNSSADLTNSAHTTLDNNDGDSDISGEDGPYQQGYDPSVYATTVRQCDTARRNNSNHNWRGATTRHSSPRAVPSRFSTEERRVRWESDDASNASNSNAVAVSQASSRTNTTTTYNSSSHYSNKTTAAAAAARAGGAVAVVPSPSSSSSVPAAASSGSCAPLSPEQRLRTEFEAVCSCYWRLFPDLVMPINPASHTSGCPCHARQSDYEAVITAAAAADVERHEGRQQEGQEQRQQQQRKEGKSVIKGAVPSAVAAQRCQRCGCPGDCRCGCCAENSINTVNVTDDSGIGRNINNSVVGGCAHNPCAGEHAASSLSPCARCRAEQRIREYRNNANNNVRTDALPTATVGASSASATGSGSGGGSLSSKGGVIGSAKRRTAFDILGEREAVAALSTGRRIVTTAKEEEGKNNKAVEYGRVCERRPSPLAPTAASSAAVFVVPPGPGSYDVAAAFSHSSGSKQSRHAVIGLAASRAAAADELATTATTAGGQPSPLLPLAAEVTPGPGAYNIAPPFVPIGGWSAAIAAATAAKKTKGKRAKKAGKAGYTDADGEGEGEGEEEGPEDIGMSDDDENDRDDGGVLALLLLQAPVQSAAPFNSSSARNLTYGIASPYTKADATATAIANPHGATTTAMAVTPGPGAYRPEDAFRVAARSAGPPAYTFPRAVLPSRRQQQQLGGGDDNDDSGAENEKTNNSAINAAATAVSMFPGVAGAASPGPAAYDARTGNEVGAKGAATAAVIPTAGAGMGGGGDAANTDANINSIHDTTANTPGPGSYAVETALCYVQGPGFAASFGTRPRGLTTGTATDSLDGDRGNNGSGNAIASGTAAAAALGPGHYDSDGAALALQFSRSPQATIGSAIRFPGDGGGEINSNNDATVRLHDAQSGGHCTTPGPGQYQPDYTAQMPQPRGFFFGTAPRSIPDNSHSNDDKDGLHDTTSEGGGGGGGGSYVPPSSLSPCGGGWFTMAPRTTLFSEIERQRHDNGNCGGCSPSPGPGAYAVDYAAVQPRAPQALLQTSSPRFFNINSDDNGSGGGGVGPGAYEAADEQALDSYRRPSAAIFGTAPRSAGKDSTNTGNSNAAGSRGPGAYELPGLPTGPAFSFGASLRGDPNSSTNGEGVLGNSGRGGATPGPGVYNTAEALDATSRHRRPPQALLASSSPRFADPLDDKSQRDFPGPGSYDPDTNNSNSRGGGGVPSLFGTAPRYLEDDATRRRREEFSNVGPGSYSPHSAALMDANSGGGGGVVFGQAARFLSHDNTSTADALASADVPGPGSYDPLRPLTDGDGGGGGVAFGTAQRFPSGVGAAWALPGPGAYDPHALVEGSDGGSGGALFGQAPRFPSGDAHANGTAAAAAGPGPGAYDADTFWKYRDDKQAGIATSTAAASTAPPRVTFIEAAAEAKRDVPGPGSYIPQFASVEAAPKGIVFGSSRRDGGDSTGNDNINGSGMGPGAYSPPQHEISGNRAAIFGSAPRDSNTNSTGGGGGGVPGPGTYEVFVTRDGTVLWRDFKGGGASSAFCASSNNGGSVTAVHDSINGGDGAPGPGSYDAQHDSQMPRAPAYLFPKAQLRSAAGGGGGDNSSSVDSSSAAAALPPGPSSYSPQYRFVERQPAHVVFGTATRDTPDANNDGGRMPGPGDYDGVGGGGPAVAFPTAPRFGTGGNGDGGGVAPGSYDTARGERATCPSAPAFSFTRARPNNDNDDDDGGGGGANGGSQVPGPGSYDIAGSGTVAHGPAVVFPTAPRFPLDVQPNSDGSHNSDYDTTRGEKATHPAAPAYSFSRASNSNDDGNEGGGGGGGVMGSNAVPGPSYYEVSRDETMRLVYPTAPAVGFGTAPRGDITSSNGTDSNTASTATGGGGGVPGPGYYSLPPAFPLGPRPVIGTAPTGRGGDSSAEEGQQQSPTAGGGGGPGPGSYDVRHPRDGPAFTMVGRRTQDDSSSMAMGITTPGPAAYDTTAAAGAAVGVHGGPAFTVPRAPRFTSGNNDDDDGNGKDGCGGGSGGSLWGMPGPGDYDVSSGGGDGPAVSFARAVRQGPGSAHSAAVPGPGHYNLTTSTLTGVGSNGGGGGGVALRYTAARFAPTTTAAEDEQQTGYDPGAYAPSTAHEGNSGGPSFPTADRFAAPEHQRARPQTGPSVGPGSYDAFPMVLRPTAASAAAAAAAASSSSAAGGPVFGTASRGLKSNVDGGGDMPGPGAYDLPSVIGRDGPSYSIAPRRSHGAFNATQDGENGGGGDGVSGPASYDTVPNNNIIATCGPTAVMTTAPRFDNDLLLRRQEQVPGPGSYDTIAAAAVSSLHASSPAFTMAGRRPGSAQGGENIPGPGTYDAGQALDALQGRGPAFALSTAPTAVNSNTNNGVPGPGTYNLDLPPAGVAVGFGMGARLAFANNSNCDDGGVGPGVYDVYPRPAGPAFSFPVSARQQQRLTSSETPGPGSYPLLGWSDVTELTRGRIGPTFSHGAGGPAAVVTPGPGDYYTHAPPFNGNSGGVGGIGLSFGLADRPPLARNNGVPGPGSYHRESSWDGYYTTGSGGGGDGGSLFGLGECTMHPHSSSAAALYTPGPGAYYTSSNGQSIGGGGGGYSFGFGEQHQQQGSGVTAAVPGPNAYSQLYDWSAAPDAPTIPKAERFPTVGSDTPGPASYHVPYSAFPTAAATAATATATSAEREATTLARLVKAGYPVRRKAVPAPPVVVDAEEEEVKVKAAEGSMEKTKKRK